MKGSITKRVGKRGVTWQVVVDLPADPVTGKRRQKFMTAPTKREAEALARTTLSAIEMGEFAEADAKKITVSEYLTRWLASLEGTVRLSTQVRYRQMVKQHMEPMIGRVPLSKLSPLDVQRLYADRLAAGLSPTTVDLLHNILHKALKQAMRWRLLARNVTEAVDAPRRNTPEYTTWNECQSATFLAAADKVELATLWRLALLTGLRRGETLALQWEDIDLVRGSLSVRRTISRGNKGTYTFGMPKTAHGRRSIALPPSVVESLKRHRIKQQEERQALKVGYQDHGLVFADKIGEPLHPNTLTYQFKRLCTLAGVPIIRIHDLRHTSATLMLANGEHPKIVQERLGHANISMTLDRYSHVTMDMQKAAADRLDTLIGGNR